MKINNREKLLKIVLWFILIISSLFLFYFLYKKIPFQLDSDMSSELVLSKILSTEKRVITDSWFYSTELRVLNTQLVFAPLFSLTNNWFMVRIISTMFLLLLMLASYYYLCKQINCKKYFAISSLFLVLPFSITYYEYVLKGTYYYPHIIISFLTLGTIFKYINSSGKSTIFLLIFSSILGILAGAGGPRQLIVLYIPLVLSGILWTLLKLKSQNIINIIKSKSFKFVKISFILFVSSIIGYLINTKILSNLYYFQSWDNLSFTYFDFSRIITVINGILANFNYSDGELFSSTLISNFTCFIIVFLLFLSLTFAIKKKENISEENHQLSLIFLSAIIIYFILYSFTNIVYHDRYLLPILILAIPIIMINLKEVKIDNLAKKLIIGIITLIILLNSFINYQKLRTNNYSLEFHEISRILKEEGYKNGYATFWNGNLLTEISNGDIEMYVWLDSCPDGSCIKDLENIDKMMEWLQSISHVSKKPEGKVFMLFKSTEINYFPWKENLKEENIVYNSENIIIYGFNSYDEMVKEINIKK